MNRSHPVFFLAPAALMLCSFVAAAEEAMLEGRIVAPGGDPASNVRVLLVELLLDESDLRAAERELEEMERREMTRPLGWLRARLQKEREAERAE